MCEIENDKIYELIALMKETDEIFEELDSWERYWTSQGFGYLKLGYLTWGRIYKELGIETFKMNNMPIFASVDKIITNSDMCLDDWIEMRYEAEDFHEPDIDNYKKFGIEIDVFGFDQESFGEFNEQYEEDNGKLLENMDLFEEFAKCYYFNMYHAFPKETMNFLITSGDNNFSYPYTVFLSSKRIGNYVALKEQKGNNMKSSVDLNAIDYLIKAVFDPLYVKYDHAYLHECKDSNMYSFFAYGYMEGSEEQVEPMHSKMYRNLALILLDKLLTQVENEYQELLTWKEEV